VAFTETTVAPPTDLLIRNAVVRANGIPIFYAPVLWLRSPNRFGVLSPHFGWRASEGAWIGTGLHMPLRGSEQSSLSVVDVNVGSYLRGGLDLGGQLTTPRSTTQLRWDRLDTSFVEVNSLFVEQASLHERLAYTQARSERVRAGLAGGEFRASLPLVKNWGKSTPRWSLWIEPFTLAAAAMGFGSREGTSPDSARVGTSAATFL
jgi:hypothetical protein